MTIDHLYDQALQNMAAMLTSFEARVPPPQKVSDKDSFVFRYIERRVEQAIVQKLARLVSGLHAARRTVHSAGIDPRRSGQATSSWRRTPMTSTSRAT